MVSYDNGLCVQEVICVMETFVWEHNTNLFLQVRF